MEQFKPDLSQYREQYSLDIVSKTVSFDIARKDEFTGEQYKGHFKIKLFLSLKERTLAAASYSKKNLGVEKTDPIYSLNKIICELQAASVECPEWFKGDEPFNIVDAEGIIDMIFTLHLAAGEEYISHLQSR